MVHSPDDTISTSWIRKQYDSEREALLWEFEVRSERTHAGSVRLGEVMIRSGLDGLLRISATTIWNTF